MAKSRPSRSDSEKSSKKPIPPKSSSRHIDIAASDGPRGIGRRRFAAVTISVAGAGIAAIKAVAPNAAWDAIKMIYVRFAGPRTHTIPGDLELLKHLFFDSPSPMDVVPSAHHSTQAPTIEVSEGVYTYPNQEQAITAIRDLFETIDVVWDEPWEIDPTHSLICIGSPASNLVSKRIFGSTLNPRFRIPSHKSLVHLPYALALVPGVKVWRVQDGRRHQTDEYAIIDHNGNHLVQPAVDVHKKLLNDFLLVSRIPGRREGTDIVIYSGLHGPAIRAIDLLFYCIHPKDLVALKDSIGASRYFQAVFRVTELREDGGTTVPSGLELVRTKCPPVPLEF